MSRRISEMDEAVSFDENDLVPIVKNGANKKVLGSKIKDFIAGFFVSKSGDTMTGNLLIQTASPFVRLQDNNLTVDTSSNNGLTAETSANMLARDTAGQFFGRSRALAKTDGSIEFQLTARNMNTSGSRITNGFSVGVKKDGTKYYSVDDAAAFRSAIGLSFVIGSITQTTDSMGRIAVQIAINKPCLRFWTGADAVVSGMRRDLNDVNRTLVFVRKSNDEAVLANTETTIYYSYFDM